MPKTAKPRKHGNRWQINFLDATGKRAYETYPSFAEAKAALARRNTEAEEIKSGARAAPPPPKTFEWFADYYLEHYSAKKRSEKDDKSAINKHLKPHFGSMLLTKITLREVHQFEKKLVGLSPKTVKNYLTLLIAMLNQAVELGYLNTVPTIKKPKVAQEDYSWLRTPEEIRRLLVAAEDERDGVMQLYAAAVYTGMRKGELAGLQWANVDFERRLISVLRSYRTPTKNGLIRHVPLLDPLVPVLKAWRLRCPDPWVFTGQTGNMLQSSAPVFQEVFQRCMVRAKLAEEGAPTAGRLTFHDLRHTFASHWVMNGGDIFKLQKILGHTDIKMTLRYAHLAPEAFQADWARLKDAVPKAGNVIAMEGDDEAAG